MQHLSKDEIEVLHLLSLRPGGATIREAAMKETVLRLCGKRLVCDPHTLGSGALFTRITDEGKSTLAFHS